MIRKDILLSIRELSSARHARAFVNVAESIHLSDLAEALCSLPTPTILSLTGRLLLRKRRPPCSAIFPSLSRPSSSMP